MKSFINPKYLLLMALTTGLTFSACSSVNNEVESLSEEDIQFAAEIAASSLADDESGLISSMYDAFSNVDATGIFYFDGRSKSGPRGNGGRGRERNYSFSYDSLTGVHTISYERIVENNRYSKSVSTLQEIIYTDLDGEFIARPRAERDSIEAIVFNSNKTGSYEDTTKTSSFTKTDSFDITGVHSTNTILTMDGTHTGIGDAEGALNDSTSARSYEINLTYENVEINKDTVEVYGNLENGVSGTITYSISMSETINGIPQETLVEGVIDLEEDDGTALMRFDRIDRVIRFSLKDGKRRN
ncbi:MAG: hypothetical protein ED557_02430 [Balneola sp.]|nr:MAG: hypothetical protein ED557_02430 [Balneola sp.]